MRGALPCCFPKWLKSWLCTVLIWVYLEAWPFKWKLQSNEQRPPVQLFIMPYKVVLSNAPWSLCVKSSSVTTQTKAIEKKFLRLLSTSFGIRIILLLKFVSPVKTCLHLTWIQQILSNSYITWDTVSTNKFGGCKLFELKETLKGQGYGGQGEFSGTWR